MEKILRTVALHICGLFYAVWLILRNVVGRTRFLLRYGNPRKQTLSAIKKANALHVATGYRYYVLQVGGRIVIKPKRQIKYMLTCRGKYFRAGTTIADIERVALYITR